MVECYAATPSSTSLKTLVLLGILQGHQTTCLDVSTAFINTPLAPTNHHKNGTTIPLQHFPYNTIKTKEGHVRTTYKSEALATTLGGGPTPTKSTTMQGRPLSLDYACWTRSFDLCRRLVAGWRDYKDITVHLYSEGYFHVEACDYTFQRSRCPLFGKRLQLHEDNSISIFWSLATGTTCVPAILIVTV